MSASLEQLNLDDEEAPFGGEDSESQQISEDVSNGTGFYLNHWDVGVIDENANSDNAMDKLHNVPQRIAATTATIHWMVFKSDAGNFDAEAPVGSASREIRREGTLCRYWEGWLTNKRYFRADDAPQGNCGYFDVRRRLWLSRPGSPFSPLVLGGILLYWLLVMTVKLTYKMPMQPTGKQVMWKAKQPPAAPLTDGPASVSKHIGLTGGDLDEIQAAALRIRNLSPIFLKN